MQATFSVTDLITSPSVMALHLAQSARALRLSQNLSQSTLASQAGVSFGTLRKFEATGKVSLKTLLKVAAALGVLGDFRLLFCQQPEHQWKSLDDLLNARPKNQARKRGRT